MLGCPPSSQPTSKGCGKLSLNRLPSETLRTSSKTWAPGLRSFHVGLLFRTCLPRSEARFPQPLTREKRADWGLVPSYPLFLVQFIRHEGAPRAARNEAKGILKPTFGSACMQGRHHPVLKGLRFWWTSWASRARTKRGCSTKPRTRTERPLSNPQDHGVYLPLTC